MVVYVWWCAVEWCVECLVAAPQVLAMSPASFMTGVSECGGEFVSASAKTRSPHVKQSHLNLSVSTTQNAVIILFCRYQYMCDDQHYQCWNCGGIALYAYMIVATIPNIQYSIWLSILVIISLTCQQQTAT